MGKDEAQKLVTTLKALANPIRLRIIASLVDEPKHAYALAKEMGLSYPLTHLHLKGLRKMGLVKEIEHETKTEGRPSARTYAPSKFELLLTPERIRDILKEDG
ncbi:MAG: winged helix-turn-helix transcriptional regulator [Candidatus Bathyarchaeota archaeon]|nr:MAG: winged helix-turn-helix transcriptional regulator [Candidatus Bathyarchaeota archaeon]